MYGDKNCFARAADRLTPMGASLYGVVSLFGYFFVVSIQLQRSASGYYE